MRCRLTVPDKFSSLVVPVCHHGETSHYGKEDNGHEISSDVVLGGLVVDVDGNDDEQSLAETIGDLKKGGIKGVKSEASRHKRSEV